MQELDKRKLKKENEDKNKKVETKSFKQIDWKIKFGLEFKLTNKQTLSLILFKNARTKEEDDVELWLFFNDFCSSLQFKSKNCI